MKYLPITRLLAALLLLASISLSSAETVTARYFRFTQTKLRSTSANSIQLSEFQMIFGGARLAGATATNPGGNSPAGEVPQFAVDNIITTKWLDFNKAPLVLDYGTPVSADGYRFATGGDATERDPVSWVLESSDDNLNWNLIETRDDFPTTVVRQAYTPDILFAAPIPLQIVSFNTTRPKIGTGESAELEWRVVGSTSVSITPGIGTVGETGIVTVNPAADTVYTLTATKGAEVLSQTASVRIITDGPHTYRYFRFTPTKLRQDSATSIQMSEFQLLFDGTPLTGATATNPGGNSPVGEGVANVIDGSLTTKWLDFTKGLIVLDFGSDVTTNGYRLGTANDFEDRDPIDWTLEGSPDGASWTLLDTVVGFPITTTREVFTATVPLAAVTPPTITVFTATPAHLQGGEATTLAWDTTGAQTVQITPVIPNGNDLNGTADVTPPAGLTTWTLTATNTTAPVSATASVFVEGPAQQVSWRYFRFTPVTLRNGGAADSVQISEFELSLNGVPYTGATVTNPGGNSPAGEQPLLAADGDVSTKWLDFNRQPLVLEFPDTITIDSYRIGTANDATERDPIEWKVEGSADGSAWTLIDSRNLALAIPLDRFAYTKYFHFVGTAAKVYVPVTGISHDKVAQTVTLTWPSEAGKTYLIERTAGLAAWETAQDNVASGGTTTSQTLATGALEKVFFRVSVKP